MRSNPLGNGGQTAVLPLARRYRLSAYDASYLELALRTRLPWATRATIRPSGFSGLPGRTDDLDPGQGHSGRAARILTGMVPYANPAASACARSGASCRCSPTANSTTSIGIEGRYGMEGTRPAVRAVRRRGLVCIDLGAKVGAYPSHRLGSGGFAAIRSRPRAGPGSAHA